MESRVNEVRLNDRMGLSSEVSECRDGEQVESLADGSGLQELTTRRCFSTLAPPYSTFNIQRGLVTSLTQSITVKCHTIRLPRSILAW